VARRWRWFLRAQEIVDLTGEAVQDAKVPGQYRRRTVDGVIPELRVRSRCDGAMVYERLEERQPPITMNQRPGRYSPPPPRRRTDERS
jgi:hypothetical protein